MAPDTRSRLRWKPLPNHQSAVIPRRTTTSRHRAISESMRALNAIDVPPAGSIPSERSRATTSGSATIVASTFVTTPGVRGEAHPEGKTAL